MGYRGCGKTTIGKRLADRLWQPFIDVDDVIVRTAGRTIKEVFEKQGEPFFRELEARAVKQVCALSEHVISLGGGTLGREENRRAIKNSGHKVVYLRCEPKELHRRIQADPESLHTRPHLTPLCGSIEEIKKMLAEREPFYREVMTTELDVTNLTPEEAVVYVSRLV